MDPVPAVASELTGLAYAAPARAETFLVEGDRCWVRGVESRPGLRIGRGPDRLLTVTAPDLGTAANILLFPGVLRRDFVSAGGSCVETVLTAPALPLVVVQWRGDGGGLPHRIEVESERRPARDVEPLEDGVDLLLAGGEDLRVGVRLHPHGGLVVQELGRPERTRAILERRGGDAGPDSPDILSLVVAFGPAGTLDTTLAAARHVPAHAVRASAGSTEGLLLRTGIEEVDDGVGWLRSRLRGQCLRRGEGPPTAAFLVPGLAATAVGDRAAAEALLGASIDADPMATALLAARFASTFGDRGLASDLAGAWLDETALDEATHGRFGGGPALDALAAEELARALHGSTSPDIVRALRIRAARSRSSARPPARPSPDSVEATEASPSDARERRLPMAASSGRETGMDEASTGQGADVPALWLERLLAGDPEGAVPTGGDAEARAARRATARFTTDPDGAWSEWRRLLAAPLGGRGPAALWDAADPMDPWVGTTAELLLGLAHGLLGLSPDAAVGRIRLAPRLPSHITAFEAGGICVGRCSLRLRYERSGGLLRFELEAEAAPIPPLVVLEPHVRGTVAEVRVDGAPADLDVRTARGSSVVAVQLPLDARRSLEVELGR